MNLHPFNETVRSAQEKMLKGWLVFQQWHCEWCGAKQTMDQANTFFTQGICEECGELTDIQKHGCNFMGVWEPKEGKDEGKA